MAFYTRQLWHKVYISFFVNYKQKFSWLRVDGGFFFALFSTSNERVGLVSSLDIFLKQKKRMMERGRRREREREREEGLEIVS
jgi:hypothetical protein